MKELSTHGTTASLSVSTDQVFILQDEDSSFGLEKLTKVESVGFCHAKGFCRVEFLVRNILSIYGNSAMSVVLKGKMDPYTDHREEGFPTPVALS
eukprot:scaffold23834_cov132-Cylindrotheca_fusiformis.AAC.5